MDPRKLRGKVDLNINTAIPLGLIVNELVTNIWKYAFPHGKKGEIDINLSGAAEDKYVLLVKDNGGGFPKGLVFRKTESLGMQIVIVLVEQLDGTIELERTEGTRYRIVFSVLKQKTKIQKRRRHINIGPCGLCHGNGLSAGQSYMVLL